MTKFEVGEKKIYEMKGICDNMVYAKESAAGHLPSFYYLISWKNYPKEQDIWKPILAI